MEIDPEELSLYDPDLSDMTVKDEGILTTFSIFIFLSWTLYIGTTPARKTNKKQLSLRNITSNCFGKSWNYKVEDVKSLIIHALYLINH